MISKNVNEVIFLNICIINRIPDTYAQRSKQQVENKTFEKGYGYAEIIKITKNKGVHNSNNQPNKRIPDKVFSITKNWMEHL
jgi:hypothetical protein